MSAEKMQTKDDLETDYVMILRAEGNNIGCVMIADGIDYEDKINLADAPLLRKGNIISKVYSIPKAIISEITLDNLNSDKWSEYQCDDYNFTSKREDGKLYFKFEYEFKMKVIVRT